MSKNRGRRTEVEKKEVARRLVESVYKSQEDSTLFDQGKRKILKKGYKRRGDYVPDLLPPPGRKPLHPIVYDYWQDEAKEVLDNLSETEIHAAMLKKRGITLGEEDEEENYILKQLYSHKNRHERGEELRKIWEEYTRRRLERKKHQALLHQIEDIQDPHVLGFFYTNGYYDHDPPFSVHHDYYESHMKKERDFAKIFKRTDTESFTNKFRRNFWPPKVQFWFNWKRYFRTRGSYLDFPEHLYGKDGQPKKKPDFMDVSGIDFNYDHTAVTIQDETQENIVCEDEDEGMKISWFVEVTKGNIPEEAATGDALVAQIINRLPVAKGDYSAEDFYYDDAKGEFYLKRIGLEGLYYFDGINGCWRQKRRKAKKYALNELTPYDYYYDNTGKFIPRDLFNGDYAEDISYDPQFNVWRYDPMESTHKKVVRAKFITHTQLIEAPGRPMPKDWFFDEREGIWSLKTQRKVDDKVDWDFNGFRFHVIHSGAEWENWRGTTGFSPDDFYWDEGLEKFQLRPPRQFQDFYYSHLEGIWRRKAATVHNLRKGKSKEAHNKPENFYFEDGAFKLKEPGRDDLYKRMKYALIYRKKEAPLSGLYPKDFYFDRDRGVWVPRLVRGALKTLKEANVAFNPVGPKADIPAIDDYFWDVEEGIFLKKTEYEDFFFDIDDGIWKSELQKDQWRLKIQPHDYFFNGSEFQRKRELKGKGEYVYDQFGNVFRLSTDLKDPEKSKGDPSLWYFDYNDERWHEKGDEDPETLTRLPNGLMIKRPNNNDKTPLEFAFDLSSGRFVPIKLDAQANYQFASSEGIFKTTSLTTATKSGLTSRDFYWSDPENAWRPKVQIQAKDYFWDPNNKYYRLSIGIQPRSGLSPKDYSWNPYLGKWIPKSSKSKLFNEKLNWDPLRNYDKPWLQAAKIRYKQPSVQPQPGNKPQTDKKRQKEVSSSDKDAHSITSLTFGSGRGMSAVSDQSIADPKAFEMDDGPLIKSPIDFTKTSMQKSSEEKQQFSKEKPVDTTESQATFGHEFWSKSTAGTKVQARKQTHRNSQKNDKDIFKVDMNDPTRIDREEITSKLGSRQSGRDSTSKNKESRRTGQSDKDRAELLPRPGVEGVLRTNDKLGSSSITGTEEPRTSQIHRHHRHSKNKEDIFLVDIKGPEIRKKHSPEDIIEVDKDE